MKKSLLLIAGFILPLCSQAQITIDQTNGPTVSRCQVGDSFRRLKVNTLPTITPATNATWDMTVAGDSTRIWRLRGAVSPSSAFPNASFYNNAHYNLAVLGYETTNIKNVTSSGVVMYGEHIDRQALSLAAMTSNTADSLVFPTQDIVYSAPEVHLKYPMTMSDTWTDNIKVSTNFNLTVAAFNLNNTPGERRASFTIKNTVVGWGKMKVNDENATPSGYMEVLMVKIERTVADSFYLGGSPAPTSLLTAFGLSQGQTQSKYSYAFYRAGEYAELLEVIYTDNSFSTIEKCDVHEDRLKPTSIQTISKEQINIYPNPVTNGSFTVMVDGMNENFSYQIFNITGQMVTTGILPSNGVVSLQDNLPAGTYIIKLMSNDGAVGVQQLKHYSISSSVYTNGVYHRGRLYSCPLFFVSIC